jgi:hypothetical protein
LTDHFPEAFKNFPKEFKKAKSFQDLVSLFKTKGGVRAPMTDKQTQALAAEASNLGLRDLNKQDRKGKWRNIFTGQLVKDKSQLSKLPVWRRGETEYKRGVYINTMTGEKIKIKYAKGKHKGQLMKKEKWTYTNKKGKTVKIYPKEKTKKVKKK